MSAIRRIIVNTTNAPKAIGAYNQVFTMATVHQLLFFRVAIYSQIRLGPDHLESKKHFRQTNLKSLLSSTF